MVSVSASRRRTVPGRVRNAPIGRTPQEGARCEPDELPEVGDEVCLVVIAGLGGDLRPVVGGPRCRPYRALQANSSCELLRADADALREGAAKVARRDAQALRDTLHPHLVSFEQANRLASEPRRCRLEGLADTDGERVGEPVPHVRQAGCRKELTTEVGTRTAPDGFQ